ncbi:Acyl-CoA dehydrogenase/oxidase C-terminal [Acididesulfobacillus acetoxydans]|uniref:Acyl-CoA dehydrogenase/oxidase C-terminal n=1 Tax=Acididesulfobacillus acetoxydans TaxID=1561005 RepID=A0A8S0WFR7_9FIRM|nr:acyl-CoA dehydrogenase family protein [Acididesulfobacillus acetoxydans]CAA7601292.1 Acyl-CoA dehydrogenase/oxidase C-terminal [Acididesulfobacillus acetoxydans]CEJ08798.1 Long-chain specific acyl-CoA dehydrogenase, mitochondrial [Acididesulfobacillus acetoxydans]
MTLYGEEHELFRRSFRKFVAKELVPQVEKWEEEGEMPRSVWRRLGEQGYLCPWLEEKYGGGGADFLYSVIINEELSAAGIGIAVGLHSDIIAPYIDTYGSEAQKARWLPGCATGETVLAIAMTEPGAGSDLQGIKTTAVREGEEYILNGSKTFISNGFSADAVVVVARTDPAVPASKGLSLIVVEQGTPGFAKGRKLKKLGLHSQDTAELFFDNCRVPAANRLGAEGSGFTYLMEKLQQERLVSALVSQSLARRMLTDTIDYVKRREAFGQPIGKFQHNAFKIAEMATEVELGQVFMEHLIADHMDGKEIVSEVSMAKYWIGEMANRVAYQCLQLHGGYGYMEEYPIARFYRDVRAHTVYAGTSEIMKLIIARRLGL